MDVQTVIALCAAFSVVIGIVGIAQRRKQASGVPKREGGWWRTAEFERKKAPRVLDS